MQRDRAKTHTRRQERAKERTVRQSLKTIYAIAFMGALCVVNSACSSNAGVGGSSAVPNAVLPAPVMQPQANPKIGGVPVSIAEYRVPGGARPGEITISDDGAAWFPAQYSIDRITSTGAVSQYHDNESFPGFYKPYITRDRDGNIWFIRNNAADCGNDYVEEMSLSGKTLFSNIIIDPEFCGIAYTIALGPDGRIWAPVCSFECASGQQALIATSTTGVMSFYPFAPGPNDVLQDQGLTTGPWSALYGCCTENTIPRIETSGNVAHNYTFGGARVASNCSFTDNPFTADGAYDSGGCGITEGPDRNIWFVDSSANAIGRLTPAGAFTSFPIPTPGADPRAITPASDGALWFTEHGSNKVGRITTSGAILEFTLPTADSGPRGIAACHPDGRCMAAPHARIWVTEDLGKKIARLQY